MIIVKLKGGLGNQMFQYALGRALSIDSKMKLVLDNSHFYGPRPNETPWPYALDSFDIKAQVGLPSIQRALLRATRKRRGLKKKIARVLFPVTHIAENGFYYQGDTFPSVQHRICAFDGYWQSEKYFKHHRETLLNDFKTIKPVSKRSSDLLRKITQSSASVALHIRRGDYVSNASANAVHGTCAIDYYIRAMKHMTSEMETPTFFVFSDDIGWARENLGCEHDMVFADYTCVVPAYEDMYLISVCQHQIIANSSFSWWGAWLNPNSLKTVIAPRTWFQDTSMDVRDLLPEKWLSM